MAIVLLGIADAAPMKMFQSVDASKATLLQKSETKMFCPTCGMHLPMFYKTNHAAKVNGVEQQFCSIHCLADEMENNNVPLTDIRVVDVTSLKFIDVSKATYVVGSDVKGTMTMVSKYAFANKADAKAFATKNGGKLLNFKEMYAVVAKGLAKESMMIGKKQAKMAQKGKMMVQKMCDASKIKPAFSVAEAKAQIIKSKACKNINGKQLQAIGLYIANKDKVISADIKTITVPKKAKCPVCGMFVSKYPKWAAEIVIGDGSSYFDGVKDMMKFYLDPTLYGEESPNFKHLYVTDYYTLEKINAKTATYVHGSDVYGPMGHELIPFKTANNAKNFVKDHGGTVVTFDTITPKLVHSLDQ
ncbi:MAG: nitrous oxide reductase accessory protein NosL [Campylobacterota bacterium]|nr:nitrous oxide reductase accessory protein NosL [Campylobacterota bacterium]